MFPYGGINAISLGTAAGATGQGPSAIAIGYQAGSINQPPSSIIINATGSSLSGVLSSALYVAPIRNANASNFLMYDTVNKEIVCSTSITGTLNASSISAQFINYSSLSGSTITSNTQNASTITSQFINYSSLFGSTISTTTIIANTIQFSTLSGSTISGTTATISSMFGSSITSNNVFVNSTLIVSTLFASTIVVPSLNLSEFSTLFGSSITVSTIAFSTITGNSLIVNSTLTVSTLFASTIIVPSLNLNEFSTLAGSSITASTIAISSISSNIVVVNSTLTVSTLFANSIVVPSLNLNEFSTLTGSSITVSTIFASSISVSSLSAQTISYSTLVGSTISTATSYIGALTLSTINGSTLSGFIGPTGPMGQATQFSYTAMGTTGVSGVTGITGTTATTGSTGTQSIPVSNMTAITFNPMSDSTQSIGSLGLTLNSTLNGFINYTSTSIPIMVSYTLVLSTTAGGYSAIGLTTGGVTTYYGGSFNDTNAVSNSSAILVAPGATVGIFYMDSAPTLVQNSSRVTITSLQVGQQGPTGTTGPTGPVGQISQVAYRGATGTIVASATFGGPVQWGTMDAAQTIGNTGLVYNYGSSPLGSFTNVTGITLPISIEYTLNLNTTGGGYSAIGLGGSTTIYGGTYNDSNGFSNSCTILVPSGGWFAVYYIDNNTVVIQPTSYIICTLLTAGGYGPTGPSLWSLTGSTGPYGATITYTQGFVGIGTTFPTASLHTRGSLLLDDVPQQFPPGPMTSNSTYISGAYQGTYIATTSYTSNIADAFKAFDNSTSTYIQFAYPSTTINTVSGTSYTGEWIQLSMPYQVTLISYVLGGLAGVTNNSPISWVIAGSNNGTTWFLVDSRTGQNTTNLSTYTGASSTAYYTYRIIIIEAAGNNPVIGTWNLFGVPTVIKSAQGTTTINGNVGIGTTNPDALLHVNGSATISNITLAGSGTNVSIGSNSLVSGTASNCMSIGINNGRTASTGNNNILVGMLVGRSLTTGASNMLFGLNTADNVTTGRDNTVFGSESARSITSGDGNTIVGYNTAFGLTTGTYNVFIGNTVGNAATNNNYCIYIGSAVSASSNVSPPVNREIVIGDGAGNGSNTCTIYAGSAGSGSIFVPPTISPNNIGTALKLNSNDSVQLLTSGVVRAYADANGLTISSLAETGTRTVVANSSGLLSAPVSDARLKTNKITLPSVLSKVVALNPISYNWNPDSDMIKHPLYEESIQYGFTAQDVQAQFPDFVYDLTISGSDTQYFGFDERKFTPILVKAVQEQQTTITAQQTTITEQQTTITTLQAQLTAQQTTITAQQTTITAQQAQLQSLAQHVTTLTNTLNALLAKYPLN